MKRHKKKNCPKTKQNTMYTANKEIMIFKHCLMPYLLIGMHTISFNDTIICFYTELLTHSLHKLNMKADEINSQTEC